ncbi:MAG: cytochrome c biogenesis protein CcdA [Bacteroidota bacterium]|nr:cytochrome c biogenesis protein CcdA [Bacteroidota bacterium]
MKQGGEAVVLVSAKIDSGWHIYAATPMQEGPEETRIDFARDAPLQKIGTVRQPKPNVAFDQAFGINTEYFEREVTFRIPVRIGTNVPAGPVKTVARVRYMGCNDRLCIPPRNVEVPLAFEVIPGDSAKTAEGMPAHETTGKGEMDTGAPLTGGYGDAREVEAARSQGLWAYLGLAMTMGALSLLTPCVFPMIPITISFFTKREQATRGRGVRDALIYSFGIVSTFTVLGVLLAVLFGASGINKFAANPWINLLIAGIFIAFALNLFGLFEIVVPSGLLTRMTEASGKGGGIVSLLLMGLTFTMTSFTCTVPFIGTVMVAAASGEIWWSVAGMLAYSVVFACPFFLLALFPSWLKTLPKSGGWLNSVKVVMGMLELAAAMKFISNVDLVWALGILSRDMFLSFWVGIGFMTSLYLIGLFQLPHDTKPERIGVFRMLFAVFFLGISVYLYTGLGARPLGEIDAFLPPIEYNMTIRAVRGGSPVLPTPANPAMKSSGASGIGEADRWGTDYDESLRIAHRENKLVFIDFTGLSCTNCRWMESNVFTLPEVRELLSRFVIVRLYTDMSGEESLRNRKMQEERFGTVALPLYAVMRSDDTIVDTFPGMTRKPEEFVAFLKRALDKGMSARKTDG